jgi:uncharacterized protein YbaR (Trm112 family)
MPISYCHICEKRPRDHERYGNTGLVEGIVCPICHKPACRHHLGTVRWRWRTPSREVASALVCMECKNSYRHREWDPLNRDWIS